MKNKLFVVSGSSGVGKGTILKEFLAKNPDFVLSVSCTTRKPRQGEVHGVNYFYISEKDFKNGIDKGEFLEWAEFAQNLYGTKKSFVDECFNNSKNVILELETTGALNIKKQIPESILIFIAPPDLKTLEQRLRNRHTEDEYAIRKRLSEVEKELERAKLYDYTIINDSVENAVQALENIVQNEAKNG